jgi:uncharacterized damage-inducible protein DinB
MKTKQELTAILKAVYDGEPWFGESLVAKLKGITEEQAFQQPKAGEHSIAQIVCHMNFWRRAVLARIRGEATDKYAGDSPDNWPSPDSLKAIGWQAIRWKVDETQKTLLASLDAATPLAEDVADTLAGTLQHDVYHLGQIGYIKKLV